MLQQYSWLTSMICHSIVRMFHLMTTFILVSFEFCHDQCCYSTLGYIQICTARACVETGKCTFFTHWWFLRHTACYSQIKRIPNHCKWLWYYITWQSHDKNGGNTVMIFSETVRPTILGVRSEILAALLYLRVVCISHCCTAGQNGGFEGPLGLGTENGDGCVLSYQILWSTSQDIFSQNSHCHS